MAHRANGDEASATLELRAAHATFERLGATLEAERCEDIIRAGEHQAGRRVARTFMFTDIVGSTNLLETIGDEAWEDVVRWHDETLRSVIESHRGEVVHTTGDGFFATFEDATAAATCAVAIQRRLAEHRKEHGFAPNVTNGVHTTEATRLGLFGARVSTKPRGSTSLAEGGEIVASRDTVTSSARSIPVSDTREVRLKRTWKPTACAIVVGPWVDHPGSSSRDMPRTS